MSRIWPNARIAASPGVRIGVPESTPNTPTFVIVIVPSDRSAGDALPARAFSVSSVSARARPGRSRSCASFTFGTIRPRSVAAAIPRFTYRLTTISAPDGPSTHAEFTSGSAPRR